MTDVVTLFYNEALDPVVPATTDFSVIVNAVPADVLDVTIDSSRVVLTLDTTITTGDVATVSYTPGANPIQDEAGNDAAAFTNHAVVINAAPGTYTGFGFSLGGNYLYADTTDQEREADDSAANGSKWLRFNLDWSTVESTEGVFNWSNADDAVAAAVGAGQRIVMGVGFAPAWANGGHGDDKYPPLDTADYATFCAAAATRYSGDVEVWEGWNEPNLAGFWKPAPNVNAYTALQLAGYAALKANGATVVLAGATSPEGDSGNPLWQGNFLQGFLDNGGAAGMDHWSHHPYSGDELPSNQDGPWGYGSVFANVEDGGTLRSILDGEGLNAIQIWGTEFGVSITSPDNVSQARQAQIIQDGMQDWFANSATYNLGPLLVYAYHNPLQTGYNVTNNDWSSRPALAVFAATAGIWP